MMTAPFQFPAGPASARSLALQVIHECQQRDGFVQEILDRRLQEASLSAPDRRLATQLVYGVLRRRGTLDALLRPLITRDPQKVEAWLQDALRLGIYQLGFLSQVPAHAAVHETVELANTVGVPRARGFLNGILRAATGLLTTEETSQPSADAVPLEAGRYRRLSRPVLPEPATQPVEYLASGFALPDWLVRRWLARFGWDECVRLGFWFASPPPTWLRINPLRVDRPTFLSDLQEAGIAAEAGEHPQGVRLLEHGSIRELPGYDQGWFSVQDAAAMRVAAALNPQPGWRVLDLCAAPGGKTTHLAELMHNEGRVVACDTDQRRLGLAADQARRLGLSIVETSPLVKEPPPGPFDAVLVDVPCSNTGVLGRRPEIRWRLRQTDVTRLLRLQRELLYTALNRTRSGGIVVYSTCSIEPDENARLIQSVLRTRPRVKLEEEQELQPGRPADGGYWARLRKLEVGA